MKFQLSSCKVAQRKFLATVTRLIALFLLTANTIWPQSPPPPPLQMSGLSEARLIQEIYLGRFERIPMFDKDSAMTPEGLNVRQLLLGYVVGFSDQCQSSLSPRKKEILETITSYKDRCQYLQTKFGPMSLGCTSEVMGSETKGTGVFAEPEFHQAYVAISNSQGADVIARFFQDVRTKRSDGLLGFTLNMFNDILRISVESRVLVAQHGCKSPQMQRYSKNLLAYVQGQPPVQRDETFLRNCRSEIAKIVPGARPQSCGCLQSTLRQRLPKEMYERLEDNFTQENLLSAAISKVGLHQEVSTCLK